jgi:hypothetical protein
MNMAAVFAAHIDKAAGLLATDSPPPKLKSSRLSAARTTMRLLSGSWSSSHCLRLRLHLVSAALRSSHLIAARTPAACFLSTAAAAEAEVIAAQRSSPHATARAAIAFNRDLRVSNRGGYNIQAALGALSFRFILILPHPVLTFFHVLGLRVGWVRAPSIALGAK